MNTTIRYQIKDSWIIVRSENYYQSPLWFFQDKKSPKKTELEKLFEGSYKTFRLRVRDLGNLETATSTDDANSMTVMLGGLIQAKKTNQKRKRYLKKPKDKQTLFKRTLRSAAKTLV